VTSVVKGLTPVTTRNFHDREAIYLRQTRAPRAL
jgi:hypothetical protein